RFRCSRTSSTLRSGSRKPPFSTRPDLNLDTPQDWRNTCDKTFAGSACFSEIQSLGNTPHRGRPSRPDRGACVTHGLLRARSSAG
ncbi:MAG: hypothetical protein E5V92_20615, partial [Mesorhizobium sp.]